MSEWITLQASDGNELTAYVARPAHEPKGALVVVQEIFGVNAQMQLITDEWAKDGYLCIAPAMFDRVEKGVDLGYSDAERPKAFELIGKLDLQKAPLDVDAAVEWLRSETDKNVGVVGFCFGGTMAWVAAARLKIEAAVGYYGGNITNFLSEEPQCPIMLHFGADDAHIPTENIAKIQAAHPEVPIFVYPDAGHAFARSVDPHAYVADAARLAKQRSALFFEQHLVF